ncbi:MAG TPA: lmo0937 family membrane protein [Kofleriaceae bacterium]|jgi:hypothetical protein
MSRQAGGEVVTSRGTRFDLTADLRRHSRTYTPDDARAPRVLRSHDVGLARAQIPERRYTNMLLAIALIIAIAWLLGFTVFHVATGAIHILLIVAVVVAIVHFVQGRRAPL